MVALKTILFATALVVAHHTTLPCGQINDWLAMLGKQNFINTAKKHGYSEAQVNEVIRACADRKPKSS